jgi:predicted nucleotidyltransferase
MFDLFSTPQRQRLLFHLLEHEGKINLNAVARELDMSPGLVHKYVSILETEGLVKDRVIVESPMTRSLRVIKNLMFLEEKKMVRTIRKGIPSAQGIGIYGSYRDGSNEAGSDIDIWVKAESEVEESKVASLAKELSRTLKREVDIMIIAPYRLEELRDGAESLYHSLFHSIVLWGEGF